MIGLLRGNSGESSSADFYNFFMSRVYTQPIHVNKSTDRAGWVVVYVIEGADRPRGCALGE
jgi:hypothetical protein